jgi:hypothetical protein
LVSQECVVILFYLLNNSLIGCATGSVVRGN